MANFETIDNSVFTIMQNGDLMIENAILFRNSVTRDGGVIRWRNFAGDPTDYNPVGGKRTFTVQLDKDTYERLKEEGWNVKCRLSTDEDYDDTYRTEVVVKMDSNYPPKIMLREESFGGDGRYHQVPAEAVGKLDNMRLKKVDLIIHPFVHNRGQFKIKGYLKTMYATQASDSDYLDQKHVDDVM